MSKLHFMPAKFQSAGIAQCACAWFISRCKENTYFFLKDLFEKIPMGKKFDKFAFSSLNNTGIFLNKVYSTK